jgi:hypothetical protein
MTMVAFRSFDPIPVLNLFYQKKKIIIDNNDKANHLSY